MESVQWQAHLKYSNKRFPISQVINNKVPISPVINHISHVAIASKYTNSSALTQPEKL